MLSKIELLVPDYMMAHMLGPSDTDKHMVLALSEGLGEGAWRHVVNAVQWLSAR